MNSILKAPNKNVKGNLLWMLPYFYPEYELEKGLKELKEKKYWLSLFPEGDGITFKPEQEKSENELLVDFRIAFPWMKITLSPIEEEINFNRDIFSSQIVILPLSRVEIFENIHTADFSIFSMGEIDIDKLELTTFNETFYSESNTKSLRDEINRVTQIDRSVFKERPLIVLRDNITIQKYINLKHFEDNDLIKEYSERAEEILDVIRFEYCNYTVPELLPNRAGIYNDRYSTALIYFPAYKKGFFQAREVELKTFTKGIGLRIDNIDRIQNHRLFVMNINETGLICKHALRLNSLIQESDNETSKFIQIMTLIEYIGDPFNYKPFKKVKGKVISIIAKNKTDYHDLKKRFEELTAGLKDSSGNRIHGIRTSIVHLGKRLEQIIPDNNKRKELFKELELYILSNINFMIRNCDLEWEEFDKLRIAQVAKIEKTRPNKS